MYYYNNIQGLFIPLHVYNTLLFVDDLFNPSTGVMGSTRSLLSIEDNEGVKILKKIKVELTGNTVVREVQRAFIKIDDTRRRYRLLTQPKQIIKWRFLESKSIMLKMFARS